MTNARVKSAIADLFARQADLQSAVIDDGHVLSVNGRGFVEFVNEWHEPGVRPPSPERLAYEGLAELVARRPGDFVNRCLTVTRDGRFPSVVHHLETPSDVC